MRGLFCLASLLWAPGAFAQDSDGSSSFDAPVAIRLGQPAPGDGVFLSTARAVAIYQECETAKRNAVDMEAALKAERPASGVSWKAVLAVGVVSLVVGAVAGVVGSR